MSAAVWWSQSLAPGCEGWHIWIDLQGERAQICSAEVSLLAIVTAIQAVEEKMESQAAWLQSLEGRTGTAEKKLADCEKTAMEFGNQLEGKWAMLGTLLQEYGLCRGGWRTWRTCCATGTSGS
ncbi:Zinc finger protein 212 [Plecturocebus cupreus]